MNPFSTGARLFSLTRLSWRQGIKQFLSRDKYRRLHLRHTTVAIPDNSDRAPRRAVRLRLGNSAWLTPLSGRLTCSLGAEHSNIYTQIISLRCTKRNGRRVNRFVVLIASSWKNARRDSGCHLHSAKAPREADVYDFMENAFGQLISAAHSYVAA